jgi:hypothetical protein
MLCSHRVEVGVEGKEHSTDYLVRLLAAGGYAVIEWVSMYLFRRRSRSSAAPPWGV